MFVKLKSFFKKYRKIYWSIYIIVIVLLLSVGTYFLIGGKLHARISSVTLPPHIYDSIYSDYNTTDIHLSMEVEIWNPSILPRIKRTPNMEFVFSPCIDVTFTNLTGYNTHVIVTDEHDQYNENYDEYMIVHHGISMTAVGIHVLKPGISIESTRFAMIFNEANLTRLPIGEYRMWFKVYLNYGEVTNTNAVTMNVLENETIVEYDDLPDGWGSLSPFKSCLFYYVISGVMIITPIVLKQKNKRKKQLVSDNN